MKIVYLSSAIIPSCTANSIHIMKMCQAFFKNGHDVVLFAPNLKKREIDIDIDLFDFYGVQNCFKIRKISVPNIKGRSFIYAFWSAMYAKKHKADLVYGRFLKGCYLSVLMNLSVIYESHHPEISVIERFLFSNLVIKKSFKQLVVISQALASKYKEKYSLIKKIIIAPDGADSVDPKVNPAVLRGDNKKINIGYVGNMYKGRGIEIISNLIPKCEWAHFHFIGGSSEDIERWKKKTSNYENVFFYGHLPHSMTSQYISALDILIAPYQGRVSVHGGGKLDTVKWMSPLKIFEYMASGKAIVASDLPVLKEILEHERNALLASANDVNEWVKALERLKSDLDLRKRLGQQAKIDFEKNYTWKIRAEKILQDVQ